MSLINEFNEEQSKLNKYTQNVLEEATLMKIK